MIFRNTLPCSLGSRFWPAGSVLDDPGFVMPCFVPLDAEAQEALKAIGVDLPVEGVPASVSEPAPPKPAQKPAKRSSRNRQPY